MPFNHDETRFEVDGTAKIEAMRRSDEGLNRTITQLVGAIVAQT